MDLYGAIALWGVIGGVAIALAVLFLAPADLRATVQRQCLRFGSGGILFLIVWSFVTSGGASAQAELAVGLLVVIPFVVGVVLALAGKLRAR